MISILMELFVMLALVSVGVGYFLLVYYVYKNNEK